MIQLIRVPDPVDQRGPNLHHPTEVNRIHRHGSSNCCCCCYWFCPTCCGCPHDYQNLHWIRAVRKWHCWSRFLRGCLFLHRMPTKTTPAVGHHQLHVSSHGGDRFPLGVPWSGHACRTTCRANTVACHRPVE